MVSIRAAAIALVAAALLAGPAGPWVPVGSASPAGTGSGAGQTSNPTVDLADPDTLPVGDPPRVAYLDYLQKGSPVFRPGKLPLEVAPDRVVRQLTRVHGGYAVVVSTLRRSWVRFVGDDGRVRDLFHPAGESYPRTLVASRDGRLLAITVAGQQERGERLVIVRVANGARVVQHAFTVPYLVASFTARRALLTTGWWNEPGNHLVQRTSWWNLHTQRTRLIDRSRLAHLYYRVASPADLTAGQVALVRGDHHRVAPLTRAAGKPWRTSPHEWVLGWSPDDRYVLTGTRPALRSQQVGDGWNDIVVRRAHGGAIVQRFHGYTNLYVGATWSPIWEDDQTFVLPAGYGCSGAVGEGFGCSGRTLVRCTLHSTCEQVALPDGVIQPDERRTPPS